MRERGSGHAAVVLGRHYGGFFAGGVGDDLLHVFVAALGRFPVGVAEGFGDGEDVEIVEEGLVRVFIRGGG